MHSFPPIPRSLVAAACVFVAACGVDLLGPLNNTVYVLRTVDGQPLPATVTSEFGGLSWIVTADTIRLESGSRWKRHSVQHREPGVGGDPLDYETDGRVARQGEVIILDLGCEDGDCIAPDRFRGTPTRLEMEQTYLHEGRNLVFEPI